MKKYLGDGVYFEWDGFMIVLTTHNGMFSTNEICLEPETVIAFTKALNEVAETIKTKKATS